jgi:predicted phage tail protein
MAPRFKWTEFSTAATDGGLLRVKEWLDMTIAIGEGRVVGPYSGNFLQDLYFEGTPVQSAGSTSLNFNNVEIDFRDGSSNQTAMTGAGTIANEAQVGVEIKKNIPVTRSYNNICDWIAIRLAFPDGIRKIDSSSGQPQPSNAEYKIEMRQGITPFATVAQATISGRSDGYYSFTKTIPIPSQTLPIEIRISRLTDEPVDNLTVNKMFWAASTILNDKKLRYPNTALLRLRFPADAIRNGGVPERKLKGRGKNDIRIPINYDPLTRSYTGIWNGQWKCDYTNNPVWIYLDLCTNPLYGFGERLKLSDFDKWSLYKVAKYCDEFVPDGRGGFEPRFTFNALLRDREEAYKILERLAATFRGMVYYLGGAVVLDADRPTSDIGRIFADANVRTEFDDRGRMTRAPFSYSSTDESGDYNVAIATYRDFDDFDNPKTIEVRDEVALAKDRQRRAIEIDVWGCNSRGQAERVAKWLLLSARLEREAVTFAVGSEGVYVLPGEKAIVADSGRSQTRFGGRIFTSTESSAVLDRPVVLSAGVEYQICLCEPTQPTWGGAAPGEGAGTHAIAAYRAVTNPPGTHTEIFFAPPLAAAPPELSAWILIGAYTPQEFKITSVTESENGFEITAFAHAPAKFAACDTPGNLQPESSASVRRSIPLAPIALRILSIVAGKLTIAWTPPPQPGIAKYRIERQRKDSQVWESVIETIYTSIDDASGDGEFVYRIFSIDLLGRISLPVSIFGSSIPNSVRVSGHLENGAILLERPIYLDPANNYIVSALLAEGVYDSRPIVLPPAPGWYNSILTNPSFVGNSDTYIDSQPTLGLLDLAISYLRVIGGSIVCYTGQNYTGTSATFSAGTYRGDFGQLAPIGNDLIRSISIPVGVVVEAKQHEVGRNPQANSFLTIAQI